ncbi:uncharacterized protein [Neodiprion pinetum]|uniref:uncharacterized protein n=1 Tax=Neodiprion pinetum TaxID=441929 RepID=UPI0037116F90
MRRKGTDSVKTISKDVGKVNCQLQSSFYSSEAKYSKVLWMLRIRACMFLCSLLGPKDVSPCACIADDPRDKSGLKRLSEQFNRKRLKMASADEKDMRLTEQDYRTHEIHEDLKDAREALACLSVLAEKARKRPEKYIQALNAKMITLTQKTATAKQKIESMSEKYHMTVEINEHIQEAKEALAFVKNRVDKCARCPKKHFQRLEMKISRLVDKLNQIEANIIIKNTEDLDRRQKSQSSIPESPNTHRISLDTLIESIDQLTVERDSIPVTLRELLSLIRSYNPRTSRMHKVYDVIAHIVNSFDQAKLELRSLEDEETKLNNSIDDLTDVVTAFSYREEFKKLLERSDSVLSMLKGKK